jgi:hypothetical protein
VAERSRTLIAFALGWLLWLHPLIVGSVIAFGFGTVHAALLMQRRWDRQRPGGDDDGV